MGEGVLEGLVAWLDGEMRRAGWCLEAGSTIWTLQADTGWIFG